MNKNVVFYSLNSKDAPKWELQADILLQRTAEQLQTLQNADIFAQQANKTQVFSLLVYSKYISKYLYEIFNSKYLFYEDVFL